MDNKITIELNDIPPQLVNDYRSDPSNYKSKIHAYLMRLYQDKSDAKNISNRIAESLEQIRNGQGTVLNDDFIERFKKSITKKV